MNKHCLFLGRENSSIYPQLRLGKVACVGKAHRMNLLRAGNRVVEGEHQEASNREAGPQLGKQDSRCDKDYEEVRAQLQPGVLESSGTLCE